MSYWPRRKNALNPILFIHIPKTAGTSIRKWFKQTYGKIDDLIHAPVSHPTISNLNKAMPSFTIIRNPYDRAYSFYKYRKQILELHVANRPSYVAELEVWNKGFDAWIENYLHRPWTVFDGDLKIYYPGGVGDLAPWANMIDYISLDNSVVIDHIIKIENLDEDFKIIKDITKSNHNIPHKNKSNNQMGHYSKVYTSLSKKIVENLYEKDLNYFNYNF